MARRWKPPGTKALQVTGNQRIARTKLELARELRREMTAQERSLWERLRNRKLHGIHFRRQQVIAGYIVDFYCASARLAVEIDGTSHLAQRDYDAERDRALAEMGIDTLRIGNDRVTSDLIAVVRTITEKALARVPPNPPSTGSANA